MIDDTKILQYYETTKLLLPRLPQKDDFLTTIFAVFEFACWFGIPNFGGSLPLLWCIFQFIMLLAIEVGALYKLIRAITGVAIMVSSGRSIIGRLSGAIFYANAIICLILSWKLASAWKKISSFWSLTERTNALYFPPDVNLKKKLTLVIVLVSTCSIVEHSLSMMSATGFSCPPSEFFERYILSSHGFLMRPDEYSLWLAVPIFMFSKTATCLWNFQDSIIILISMGLSSRYRRLNVYVEEFTQEESQIVTTRQFDFEDSNRVLKWRRVREAFVRQAALVRRVDKVLGGLIMLSNFNNFYFICLQLFFGIGGERPSFINKLYYLTSLSWLCFRACSVVLAAADINVHASAALKFLYGYPPECYNIEVQRLVKQLSKDHVALSGMRFFYLDRTMLLRVAAAILTYELVLLQYDT